MADINHDHPLQATRPSVPPSEQPRSLESHPGHVDDFEHDATVAHEESDVNIRAIAAFVVALFVLGIIVHLTLWALMGLFQREAAAADPAVTPLAQPAGTLPPEPRLLTNEPAALQQLRDEENAQLKDIENAKKAVVGQLPARAEGKPLAESPARASSRMDTSSGRRQ